MRSDHNFSATHTHKSMKDKEIDRDVGIDPESQALQPGLLSCLGLLLSCQFNEIPAS